MQMDKVAGSHNDEWYTPAYAVRPILPFLKPHSRVWCPFDTPESNFVKVLYEAGHTVICSHISMGMDFFSCTPPECDYIISNPPYTKKTEVLKRLFEIGKPFAMLIGVVGLFESSTRFEMFRSNPFEVLYLNKRVSFLRSYTETLPAYNPPFSSVYVCSRLLPERIMFSEIEKK